MKRTLPAPTSFLSEMELNAVGLGACGRNVRLSRHARLYNPQGIFLADEVRIDDFAILSPGAHAIELEGHNHVAAASMIFGPCLMREYSTLSSRVAVYGVSDDFTTLAPTYPHVEQSARRLKIGQVRIGRNVVIGTGSTVLPSVEIADDVAVGAMSLVTSSILTAGVWAGIPVRRISDRR